MLYTLLIYNELNQPILTEQRAVVPRIGDFIELVTTRPPVTADTHRTTREVKGIRWLDVPDHVEVYTADASWRSWPELPRTQQEMPQSGGPHKIFIWSPEASRVNRGDASEATVVARSKAEAMELLQGEKTGDADGDEEINNMLLEIGYTVEEFGKVVWSDV